MSIGARLIMPISFDNDTLFYSLLEQVADKRDLTVESNALTPLSVACQQDKPHYAGALLKKGADAGFKSGIYQKCPIHFAADKETGGLKCVELLFEYGADLNAQDLDENTALHLACTMENIDVFDFLIDHDANLNLLDLDQETPLIKAIVAQNTYMFKRLVKAGCDINFPNGDPMEYLLRVGENQFTTECINLLISHGATLDKNNYLHAACASNYIDMMHILKRHGIEVNALSDTFEFSALHHACVSRRSNHVVVELLLEWGADANAESSTNDTPLHYAAQQCDLKKVYALLDYNADVNKMDSGQLTPLGAILTSRFTDDLLEEYFKIAKLFIAAGARVTREDLELFEKEIPMALSSMQTEEQILDYIYSIKDYITQPAKLQDLCRQKVRCCLSSKICSNVQKLTLPNFLKKFLMFEDII